MTAPEPRANPNLRGHEEAEALASAAMQAGRLHHAWLISGPPGIGKATFAFRFARRLLAGRPDASSLALAADHPVFRRVAAGTHADLLTIERPEDQKTANQPLTMANSDRVGLGPHCSGNENHRQQPRIHAAKLRGWRSGLEVPGGRRDVINRDGARRRLHRFRTLGLGLGPSLVPARQSRIGRHCRGRRGSSPRGSPSAVHRSPLRSRPHECPIRPRRQKAGVAQHLENDAAGLRFEAAQPRCLLNGQPGARHLEKRPLQTIDRVADFSWSHT